jgi:hypothetical protein
MSSELNLVWVNKSQDSSSLSNCRNEKPTLRQIRSRAVTLGHKASRVKRPIKRSPLHLSWSQKEDPKSQASNTSLSCSQTCRDNESHPPTHVSGSKSNSHFCNHPRLEGSLADSPRLRFHSLSSILDPFCSNSVPLDGAALNSIYYFSHIWTQSAFKLPGCIGYKQPPIPQHEIATLVSTILGDTTRSYCLLAASSARMRYIHDADPRSCSSSEDRQVPHRYASLAIHGLRRRLDANCVWGEDDATDVLFLAAYEVFCEDEAGAERHLKAVRRIYGKEIGNSFVRRLQANLEVLVANVDSVVGR